MSAERTPPMPVVVEAWKAHRSGALRGFVTIIVGRSLRIIDVAVFAADGRPWVSMPTKPLVSGTRLLVDKAGKPRRGPVIEWADRESERRFSDSVIAALLDQHPGALNDGEAGR